MLWKYIKGYDNKYIINEYGIVIALNYKKTKCPKELKANINDNGYLTVTLCNKGKSHSCFVHRLVAENFINNPNPNKLKYINHIDCNRLNNHYNNLEWCTQRENMNHPPSKQKMSIVGKSRMTDKQKKVYQYTLDKKLVKIWDCVRDISKINKNFSHGTLVNHLNGIYKTNIYHDYIWSYNELA